MIGIRHVLVSLAGLATTFASWDNYPSLKVRNSGVPVGQFKNVSGINMYHSYPPGANTSAKAVLYVTDIFGVPLPENQLLADSIASNGYLVIMPDLFNGDPVGLEEQEAGLNLTEWRNLHPPEEIDRVIEESIKYMREELEVEAIGGVGYCFGGKYVPRHLTKDGGLDAGFIAHASSLTEGEISGVASPLSMAAGTLDNSFNATARSRAETILGGNNVTFQSNMYYKAPHGFAVRINASIPQQMYAKQASFVQAVTWFDSWL